MAAANFDLVVASRWLRSIGCPGLSVGGGSPPRAERAARREAERGAAAAADVERGVAAALSRGWLESLQVSAADLHASSRCCGVIPASLPHQMTRGDMGGSEKPEKKTRAQDHDATSAVQQLRGIVDDTTAELMQTLDEMQQSVVMFGKAVGARSGCGQGKGTHRLDRLAELEGALAAERAARLDAAEAHVARLSEALGAERAARAEAERRAAIAAGVQREMVEAELLLARLEKMLQSEQAARLEAEQKVAAAARVEDGLAQAQATLATLDAALRAERAARLEAERRASAAGAE
ncbi:unnamed protein product, partial [Prorocentrum cordatum]